MKKRLLSALLAAAMLTAPLTVSANALEPGEEIGQVLYTDIVAYIDGHAIRSYNINWNTYIVVEDLMAYGFDVTWIPEDGGRLVIAKNRTAAPDAYTANYQPEANTHPSGTPAMPYLYTNITTWIGDTQVTGYNIGGYTCICMDDLAAHFAAEYVWSPEDKALYMTSPALSGAPTETPAQPEIPSAGTSTELNAAEAAVAAYIDDMIARQNSGNFTEEELAALAEYEALLGKEFFNELLAVGLEINDTISYAITGSSVNAKSATVNVNVTCRDLSYAMTEYTAQLLAEAFRVSMRGEELTEEQYIRLAMEILVEVLGDDTLPLATTETIAYLDLIDGEWVVNEAASLDFLNALSGGMLSDPIFTGSTGDNWY